MNFQDFFFGADFIGFKRLGSHIVPKTSHLQKLSEGTARRFIFFFFFFLNRKIHIDGCNNYIYLFWKKPVSSFFRNNNSCIGHHTKKVIEKGVDLFIKYLLRLILCGFLLPRRYLLLYINKTHI